MPAIGHVARNSNGGFKGQLIGLSGPMRVARYSLYTLLKR
jgi:hypothetical protein